MNSFVIDTSVLIAVLTAEAEAEEFMAMLNSERSEISAATLHETYCVSRRSDILDGPERFERLVSLINPRIASFDLEQLSAARAAYSRYGRGSNHRAGLNMGDCFSYALAKTRGLPLLFKGNDFAHTDVQPALKAF